MEMDALVNLVLAIDVARVGWFGLAVVCGGLATMLGTIIFGPRYKQRIAALEKEAAAKSGNVTQSIVQNIGTEASQPNAPPLIDLTARPKSTGAPEVRFRALEPLIEAFASGQLRDHDAIWEMHYALGEIGIAFPAPGITPEVRQRISAELLAACRQGNMEAARSSWARALDP